MSIIQFPWIKHTYLRYVSVSNIVGEANAKTSIACEYRAGLNFSAKSTFYVINTA